MIRKEKFTFLSVKGPELQARRWIPEGKIRGIVQIIHGMAEHIDRYDGVAQALAGAGYLVTGHNHLGHGEGAQIRGYFGDRDGWQALIDDVHGLRELTGKAYPGVPYFLLGHSMGSFVARCYLTERAQGLAGAVISGTGFFALSVVNAGLTLANLQCAAGQTRKESRLIDRIAFSGNNKALTLARTAFDWLTRDEKEVDRYVADPWCGFPFTAGGYRDMFSGLKRLTKTEELKKIPAALPVIFISGEKDPVGAMGEGVRRVADEFKAAGIRDVIVHLYPECRHELFNELNRQEVYKDLTEWLDQHCAP